MRQAIIERISRRSFTGIPFTTEEQSKIKELVNEANVKSGLSIEFIENGGEAFSSLKKSYGMFKNVRSLLLMKGKRSDEHYKEKIGYYGEGIVLDLTDMGFGCCWVGSTFDTDTFNIAKDEEIACVVIIGKVDAVTLKERIIRSTASKNRKPVEDRIESSVDIPKWIRDGIEAVRLAPSAKNTQKVKFNYDGTKLIASIVNDYVHDLIDLGIAKRHFESEAKGHFELGNGGAFITE